MLRSLVFPGWGQFYNDEPVKGLLYGTLEFGLLGLVLYENHEAENAREMYLETGQESWQNSYDNHSDLRRDFIWYTAGAWVVGLLDAYVDAYFFSFEAENTRFENDTEFSVGAVVQF